MRWRLLSRHQMGFISNHKTLFIRARKKNKKKTASLYILPSPVQACRPPIALVHLFVAPRVHTCVCCVRFAEHAVGPWAVFSCQHSLAQVMFLKFCPEATLDPCSHRRNKYAGRMIGFFFSCRCVIEQNAHTSTHARAHTHTRAHTVFCSPHAKHCCSSILVAVVYSVN